MWGGGWGERTEHVAGIRHLDLEALQDERDVDQHLLLGERPSNAAPHAHAKRLPRVRRQLVHVQHALRLELRRVLAPDGGVAVQAAEVDDDGVVGRDLVAATEHRVVLGAALDLADGPVEAERLLEAGVDVLELVEVLDRDRVVAEHRVDLLLRFVELLRVFEEVVEEVGQRAARRLVARDQEGDHLVADVLVVELLARDGVGGVEHRVEQVVDARVRVGFALRDDVVAELVHRVDVVLHLLVGPQAEFGLHLRPVGALAALEQDGGHLVGEGMHVLGVEVVEPVVEGAESNRVEGQSVQRLLACVIIAVQHGQHVS